MSGVASVSPCRQVEDHCPNLPPVYPEPRERMVAIARIEIRATQSTHYRLAICLPIGRRREER
jgi:hypothetical protein